MRLLAVLAVLLFVLAGCSRPSAAVDEGPETPLAGTEAPPEMHLLGPHHEQGDAEVAIASCGDKNNVRAYDLTFTGSSLRLEAAGALPNATRFLVAAFERTSEGLVPVTLLRGGLDTSIHSFHTYYLSGWSREMPERISIEASSGQVVLVLACTGQGAANYIVGGGESRRPHYLPATVATGFDSMAAMVTDDPIFMVPEWSVAGDVVATYQQQVPGGLRVGETVISWASPSSGWTHVECAQGFGMSDHGTWKYDATLHGEAVQHDGFVFFDIATLGLSQFVMGYVEIVHTDEGPGPATFRFEVEHDASLQWSQTMCSGAHLGATLEELAGAPAAKRFVVPSGVVRPSTLGGWPLDD